MKMRIPQGQPGMGNMNQMIKQAQKMQEEMQIQKELFEKEEFTVSAGGGVITLTIMGNKDVKSIKLKPEVVDPDDVEMLEDLLTAAVNQAIDEVEKAFESRMDIYTNGLSVPGIF